MDSNVRAVDYFYATLPSDAGEACRWLSGIAEAGVNLLAFCANPLGPGHTQVMLFPDDVGTLREALHDSGIALTGPQKAFLVQGDDRLGAIADLYGKLADAAVEVYSSTGVTDGRGRFGYLLYIRPEDFQRAAAALSVDGG